MKEQLKEMGEQLIKFYGGDKSIDADDIIPDFLVAAQIEGLNGAEIQYLSQAIRRKGQDSEIRPEHQLMLDRVGIQ